MMLSRYYAVGKKYVGIHDCTDFLQILMNVNIHNSISALKCA